MACFDVQAGGAAGQDEGCHPCRGGRGRAGRIAEPRGRASSPSVTVGVRRSGSVSMFGFERLTTLPGFPCTHDGRSGSARRGEEACGEVLRQLDVVTVRSGQQRCVSRTGTDGAAASPCITHIATNPRPSHHPHPSSRPPLEPQAPGQEPGGVAIASSGSTSAAEIGKAMKKRQSCRMVWILVLVPVLLSFIVCKATGRCLCCL